MYVHKAFPRPPRVETVQYNSEQKLAISFFNDRPAADVFEYLVNPGSLSEETDETIQSYVVPGLKKTVRLPFILQ